MTKSGGVWASCDGTRSTEHGHLAGLGRPRPRRRLGVQESRSNYRGQRECLMHVRGIDWTPARSRIPALPRSGAASRFDGSIGQARALSLHAGVLFERDGSRGRDRVRFRDRFRVRDPCSVFRVPVLRALVGGRLLPLVGWRTCRGSSDPANGPGEPPRVATVPIWFIQRPR
jgi:hypothetical protein